MVTYGKSSVLPRNRLSNFISEKETPALEPGKCRVILINDVVTPMDFVRFVLVQVFPLSYDEACRITYSTHTKGRCLVGIFPFYDAIDRLTEAEFWNIQSGNNLKFKLEMEVEDE